MGYVYLPPFSPFLLISTFVRVCAWSAAYWCELLWIALEGVFQKQHLPRRFSSTILSHSHAQTKNTKSTSIQKITTTLRKLQSNCFFIQRSTQHLRISTNTCLLFSYAPFSCKGIQTVKWMISTCFFVFGFFFSWKHNKSSRRNKECFINNKKFSSKVMKSCI